MGLIRICKLKQYKAGTVGLQKIQVFRCTRGVAALLLEAARARTGGELPDTEGFLVFKTSRVG